MTMQTLLPFASLLLLLACGDDPVAPDLQGGVLATFTDADEEFHVWVTKESTIEQLFALRDGESRANIPNGPLLRGPGPGDHNDPWSWHYDPARVQMAELTIEICDGRPSFVEDNLDAFVEDVGRYCPWGAELVSVEDFR